MRKTNWWTLLSLALLAPIVCVSAEDPAANAWRAKMRELSAALSDTVPLLYPDPNQDSKSLTEKVKRIVDITKQLDGKLSHSVQVPDSDPTLPYVAGLLREDFERAYQSLQEGHAEYAKSVVRSSVAYCIACHTRTNTGVEFPLLSAFNEPLKRASWIEKIEFQTASRQFDTVLTEVMQQLDSSGTVGISPLDLERGSRVALSILVRYKQDPDRAALLANAILKSKTATFSMKQGAQTWLKDIHVWQREKANSYATDKDLIAEALKLTKSDSSTMGGHQEVRLLRASLLMHDLLRRFPKSESTAQALYIIGQAYDSLAEIGLWSLPEMYYMACIKQVPHTKQSQKCYKKYEESVTLGYAGSSGIHIPPAVVKHLKNVKTLAD